jgi:putative serine protease PepD
MGTRKTVGLSPHAGPLRRPAHLLTGAAVLAALALSGCTGSGSSFARGSATTAGATGSTGSTGSASTDQLESDYERVIADVLPSVVEIQSSTGLGSGVVYDDKGDVVTNAHVTGSDKQFQVLTSGSPGPLPATLVGSFPANDLAVIRVSGGQGLKPATFADSTKARVGEIVLAMGNPLGLAATVTNGIISATGRTVTEPVSADSPGATLPDAIQTSAAINPGNSGGALVDLQGQVVGIPTLAAVEPQSGGAAPGIGFAINSNQVKRIADQLVATGTVTDSGRAALGVRVRTVVGSSGQPAGVGVVEVTSGGPAAAAGIQPGDVIVAVEGNKTPSTEALSAVLAELKPGQQVTVTIERGGKQQDVKVTLGEL